MKNWHRPKHKPASQTRRRRMMTWSLALVLVASVALPLAGYVFYAPPASAQADDNRVNPRAEYWRAVRESAAGVTTASGPYTTNTLIQGGGETWREIRNGPISTYGAWFLALVPLAIGLFFMWRGRVRLAEGFSGVTVPRWSVAERTIHWFTATLFIIMAITGLSLLFGRRVLIPVMGPEGFAWWAQWAKDLHNYLGPFFTIGVVLMVVSWIRDNIPARVDWQWFRQGGGIVGAKHPSAGRMNGGEKAWFWIICTVGMATIVSGLVLDFPIFGQSRETMQIANVVHGVCSIVWIGVFFGHVYIGTLGMEGSIEAMTRGRVDVNWAEQHHDLWYHKVADKQSAAAPGGREAGDPAAPTDSILRRHYESARQRPT
ncbi:MAG: formate dehydrogenase subunit gamma [Gammaproteobacteria bacterium]